MTVKITTEFLFRHLVELHSRRESLVSQLDRLRNNLPEWAAEPLRQIGMTSTEINDLVNAGIDASQLEADRNNLNRELARLDRQINAAEARFLRTRTASLGWAEAALDVACLHLRRCETEGLDQNGAHNVARALALLHAATDCMCSARPTKLRLAS